MKLILTTKTNFMLGTVSLMALTALTMSFMTTATTPAAFAQPNEETTKKICGDTAVFSIKGTCFYPITDDCSSFPGSIAGGGSGSCIDPDTESFVGSSQIVCNQGGESDGDFCIGKATDPNGP